MLRRASEVHERAARMIWRERLPAGMLSLLAGRPGQGKGLLGRYIVAEISHGAPVVMSLREDPVAEIVRPGLRLAGARLENVYFADHTLPAEIGCLEELIRATGAALVVIDPLAAHLSVNLANDQAARRAMGPLAAMAERTECAVLMVTHLIKSAHRVAHPLLAISGSGAGVVAAARVVLILGRLPDGSDRRALAIAKSNVGDDALPALVFDLDTTASTDAQGSELDVAWLNLVGEAECGAMQLMEVGPGGARASERALYLLVALLSGGPRSANEVKQRAEELGVAQSTLRRAAARLGVVRSRIGFGPGSHVVWGLPPSDHPRRDSDVAGLEGADRPGPASEHPEEEK